MADEAAGVTLTFVGDTKLPRRRSSVLDQFGQLLVFGDCLDVVVNVYRDEQSLFYGSAYARTSAGSEMLVAPGRRYRPIYRIRVSQRRTVAA